MRESVNRILQHPDFYFMPFCTNIASLVLCVLVISEAIRLHNEVDKRRIDTSRDYYRCYCLLIYWNVELIQFILAYEFAYFFGIILWLKGGLSLMIDPWQDIMWYLIETTGHCLCAKYIRFSRLCVIQYVAIRKDRGRNCEFSNKPFIETGRYYDQEEPKNILKNSEFIAKTNEYINELTLPDGGEVLKSFRKKKKEG